MPLKVEQEEAPTINLTSMIDVLFLLIIFFMVGTKFNETEKQITLNLPKVSNASAMIAGPENRIVSIARDGTIALDGRQLPLKQLTAELRKLATQYADTAVDVRSDGDNSVQKLTEVLAAVENAGVRRIGIRTADSQLPRTR